MTIDLTPHSEPVPATDSEIQLMHLHAAMPDENAEGITFDTEAVLTTLDAKVHSSLHPFQNTVMNATGIQHLKRTLSSLPHVSSIGISVIAAEAKVDLKFLLNGVESWISALFPVVAAASTPAPVVTGSEETPAA